MLARLFPDLSEARVRCYYFFAAKLKRETQSYFNLEKLTSIWFVPQAEDPLDDIILRRLCTYSFKVQLIPSILTSKRLTTATRALHLGALRQITSCLNQA